MKIKKQNPIEWLFEPLYELDFFSRRKMFGCEAGYLNGRLSLFLCPCDGEEPWNGIMVATEREYHEELMKKWPELAPHSILGKWLYLSQNHPEFESIAPRIIAAAIKGDARIGVEPKPKKKSKKKAEIESKKKSRTKIVRRKNPK